MLLNAFFEGNPYKFWSYGANGTMHVGFSGHLPDHDGMYVADTPNAVWCEFKTWDRLVYEWLSMGGRVILHLINDEFDEFEREGIIEDVRKYACPGGGVDFRFEEIPGHGGRWCDIQVTPHDDIEPEHLFDLMHLLYDVSSNEWWDDDSCTGYVTDDVAEILAA